MRTPCKICGLPSVGRALCKKHYRAFMKYGDPLESKNLRGVPFEKRYVLDPQSGCWLWIGSTVTDGYGVWKAHGQRAAHRGSYVMHRGAIPDGMHVLHSCDMPNCVNPAHLRLGTHQENMADLRAKGRAYGAAGAANKAAKLTEVQAMSIMADPRSCAKISIEYGISKHSVDNVRNGKTWSTLFDPQVKKQRLLAGPRKLTALEKAQIACDPRKQKDIAKEYGISQSQVSVVKRGSK